MNNFETTTKLYAVQEISSENGTRNHAAGNASVGLVVSGCEKSITVKEMAQLLYQSGADTGETRLYQWLRSAGYVYRQPCGKNMPSRKSLDFGLLELRERLYQRRDGRQMRNSTLVVTPKGQEYFMLLLGGDNAPCKKNHKNRKSA